MKNVVGALAIALSMTYGADQHQASYSDYAKSCISWLARKLTAGVGLDKAMALPTEQNIADLWYRHLAPKTPPSSEN